jgi:hypothetical protein
MENGAIAQRLKPPRPSSTLPGNPGFGGYAGVASFVVAM